MFLLAPAISLFASGGDWFARVWQTDEGLPDNNISGIAQSSDGFLWVGTLGGLMRFDGARFQEFSTINLEGIPSRGIRGILLDQKNRFWLSMDRNAIACIQPDGAKIFTAKDGLPASQPQVMVEDGDGAIWLGYSIRASIGRIKDGQVTVFGAKDGLPYGGWCWLTTDAKGQLWFAKNKNLGVFRDGRFQTLTNLPDAVVRITKASAGGVWICSGTHLMKFAEDHPLEEVDRLPAGSIPTALMEDRDGAVWIGTAANGLFRRDETGIESVRTSHREISCLMQGRKNGIWVGTSGGGLNRLRPRTVELLGNDSGLPFESVRSVCEDTGGSIWVTTQNGVLARRQDTNWATISAATNWPGGNALCVASDSSGGVWIGSDRGLVHFSKGKFKSWRRRSGLATDSVRSLLVSSTGDVWVALSSRLYRLHGGELQDMSLPPQTRYIRAMAEDVSGNIWIGTSEGQLFRVTDGKAEDETPRLQGRPLSIRSLYATPDGTLWIGYAGSGLGRFSGGKFTRLTAVQGLHDEFISQIMADTSGHLWLAGNAGIFEVSMKELADVAEGRATRVRSIIYGRGEGLSSLQANYDTSPGATRSRDGRIWIPMRTGVAIVHTENIHEDPEPPPVFIERVAVDGVTEGLYDSHSPLRGPEARGLLDLAHRYGTVTLAPNHRKLEFEFTAVGFSAPENVNFRYRLEGFEDDWMEAGSQRTASYSRLGAGNYRFHVIACNNNGVWNETGATLGIVVRPFFWQTWTFRCAALLLFTVIVIAVVRYVSFRRLRRRVRLLEQQAALHNERARIAKDIHDDLGATLTQIALLGDLASQDMAQPEKAGEHVGKISTAARQVMKSLDEIVWAVNPRNDTLPHLIDYLGQFTFDFLRVPGIRCRLDLPEHPPQLNLSSDVRHNLFLAVKEALNNIVKHAHAGEVWLRVNVSNGALKVVVEDNGQGFDRPPQDAWADGLRNMRQRMAEIGGECRIESHAGSGTTITFDVPWQRN